MILAAALALQMSVAWAQATPVGLWKTIDDKTTKERSLVRITEAGGVFSGAIEKVLDPEAPPDAKCTECKDERRDKPILGFPLIRNVKQNADDASIWDGGDITDPNNGKVYRVRLRPVDAGKRLEVRGYVGPFYRTQHWQRVE
jgi:uncharacterized protein (DUF2147 family)